MSAKIIRYRFFAVSIGCMVVFLLLTLSLHAESEYPETISVLQILYKDETQALHSYAAYAEKAKSDNYPNIAKLFVSFATSESIHARNFKEQLSALGVEVEKSPVPEVKVSSTKKNLKRATETELKEIDKRYPQFIERIKAENHTAAIQYITYAWESEKQHRDLIKRIKSGTGIFFGLLTKKIEEEPAQYFVCQNCGSTLTEIPKATCPICGQLASMYMKIE